MSDLLGQQALFGDSPRAPMMYKHVQGGNVPGRHNVLWDGVRKPFITPMRECNSITLRHPDVVVDIGAYVGTYAIRAARFPVKCVVAYEPTPETCAVLSLTPLRNLEVRNAAVVDSGSEATFYISNGIGVTNSLVKKKNGRMITVPAVPYAAAVSGATIVKIDIEGGEYGLPIVQPGLRAVIIDFHKVGRDWRDKAEAIIADLERTGFTAVIKPNWSCGWTCAGSWEREVVNAPGERCEELMRGEFCCGCSVALTGATGCALCAECFSSWKPKHSDGFQLAKVC